MSPAHRPPGTGPGRSRTVPRRRESAPRPLRVVALGGGHGLAANLRALRLLTEDITAVVTVADNGGSSGRIRTELPVLPPGDLRMALAALCEDSEWGSVWGEVIQHRFSTHGDLDGHALGNLLIVALWQILEDPVEGLDQMAALIGVRGRVLPMALEPLDIEADVRGRDGSLTTVRGQWQVATAAGRVEGVRLDPARPAVAPDVVEAIARADWVIVGPGSWYTSVLPHLMIPELAEAIRSGPARLCVTANLTVGQQESEGMSSADMLAVLHEHAPGLRVDGLVADPTSLEDALDLAQAARRGGTHVLLRQVSTGDGTPTHDPVRLAAAYRDLFDDVLGDVRPDPARSAHRTPRPEEDARGAHR